MVHAGGRFRGREYRSVGRDAGRGQVLLFFKFLFIGAAAVVGLISIDYVQRFERFRTEFFALALYSATV